MKQGLEKKRLKEFFSKQILSSFEKNNFNFTDLDLLIDTNLLTERSGEQFKKTTLTYKDLLGKEISLRPDLTVSTAEDSQPAVSIRVLQGEREMAADNKLLGNFELVGIAPAPRGVPQIEVTFDIDANGIVNVSAKDKGTGKEQKIQIQASGGLSDEEIEKMVKEAEANKEADKKKRESVDARNQADTLIHSTEKNLKEHGAKISDAEKKSIEDASTALKETLKGDNVEDIKKKTETLVQASMKLGEAIYKSQQNTKPDSGNDDGKDNKDKKDDNVVDADFEEVKDENKEKSA